MNELLMTAGAFVFFISVYGAVMVGGRLLADLEETDRTATARTPDPEPDHRAGAAQSPTRRP